jgi:tRNA (cytidine/uridine-2'-O-)-methyltransferase
MFNIVLVHPEIPPNAGNIIRLAANTGCQLHLVEPLGFSLDHRQLKRAGLDYHEVAQLKVHAGWDECMDALQGHRMFAFTTKARKIFTEARYAKGDVFVFGAETAGLPKTLLESFPDEMRLALPMRRGNRSLNLSNVVAVVVYEAWRQLGFPGAA